MDAMCAVHGVHAAQAGQGKARQEGASSGKPTELPLISSMSRRIIDAPAQIVRQIDTAHQALDVAMQFSGSKAAYIAACIGKSESYVSRLRNGLKPIPAKLVPLLCQATGTNLIRQFLDMQAALAPAVDPVARIAAEWKRAA